MLASEPELWLDLGGQRPPKAKPAKGPTGDSQCGREGSRGVPLVSWYLLPIRKAAHWQKSTLATGPEEQQSFPGFPCRDAALRLPCPSRLRHWALMTVINPSVINPSGHS